MSGAELAYEHYVRRLIEEPQGAILASNVSDGEQLGLHAVGVARELLRDAYRAGGSQDDHSTAEFFRLIEDVVLGRAAGGLDYSARLKAGPPGFSRENTLTVVWPLAVLPRLISAADHRRLARITRTMRAPAGRWAEAIGSISLEDRYFQPRRRAQFGQSFVWMTSTAAIRPHIDTPPSNLTPADQCRDVLGLAHRQPEMPQLQLVALHFPFALAERLRSARPSFAEAGANPRFSARLHNSAFSPAGPLGQTIHLGRFAQGAGLQSGAPERVSLAFRGIDFRPGEVVAFDVLGPVTVPRGQHHSEDTRAFARNLRASRPAQALLAPLI